MKRLAIDTSTLTLSLALELDGVVVSERRTYLRRGHSRVMTGELEQLLNTTGVDRTSLDAVLIGLGPGSFTGVRIGHAFARGLTASLDVPLIGVPSAAGYAAAIAPGGRVAIATDARKGEVYAGVWSTGPAAVRVVPETTMKPARFAEYVIAHRDSITQLAGNGFEAYRDAFAPALTRYGAIPFGAQSASTAAMLTWSRCAAAELSSVEPLYVRPSDAELNWHGPA